MNKLPEAFRIKTTPEAIFKEYGHAKDYNMQLGEHGLYEQVKLNERMVSGNQWHGVKAPDIDKPVLNFLKRVAYYMISMIVSDNIGVNVQLMGTDEQQSDIVGGYLGENISEIMEETALHSKLRRCVRDAAVDGDACIYAYWDAQNETIAVETVANTSCLFGNPIVQTVQEQPYIIIEQARDLRDVQLQAFHAGVAWEGIKPDAEMQERQSDAPLGAKTVTVLKKFWKNPDTGTVWFCECCENVMLREPVDTGLTLYPIAWMNWEEVKESYHGCAIITGLIPNQIAVNRLWASAMWYLRQQSTPKIFVDDKLLPKWSNKPGQVIAVPGGLQGAEPATYFRAPDLSGDLPAMVEKTISLTRDFMGVNDVVLGNITPNNTSAIVAVQQSTAAPLELQRMAFYQFVEDIVRIFCDLICTNYGERTVNSKVTAVDPVTGMEVEQEQPTVIDFNALDYRALKLRVDIGEAAYWSELMQMQTLDNLFASGIITDAAAYLDSIPDKYLPNKAKLIESIEKAAKQAQGQAVVDETQDMGGMMPNAMPIM